MAKLIIDSMKSVKGKFLQQRYTFELLGYDFILDEQMNTILIEVNTNPCLEESNKLLRGMLPRMVDNLFCIVMDPLFGQIQENGSVARVQDKYKSKFPLPASAFHEGGDGEGRGNEHPGYKDDENLWKYIYTLEYWFVIKINYNFLSKIFNNLLDQNYYKFSFVLHFYNNIKHQSSNFMD